jgi:hypothetical protein
MKNSEIIKFIALFIIAAALLYRKYGKKAVKGAKSEPGMPKGSHAVEDEYEPYSKKSKTE